MDQFADYVRGLYSPDRATQLECTTFFRKALSALVDPPIQQVIDCGVVPRFVDLLQQEESPQLLFEAAWALTNITYGTREHTQTVIDAGALPVFAKLVASNIDNVKEQAVWALSNMAGDSTDTRDLVLAHGVLPAILASFSEHSRLSGLRTATWTISNLCRGNPAPALELLLPALPLLSRLILCDDDEIVTDACWALAYISDGTSANIQCVLDSGVIQRMVELLDRPEVSLRGPVLKTLANCAAGSEEQRQAIIDLNAVPALVKLVDCPQGRTAEQACMVLSHITLGSSLQTQSLIDSNAFPRLVEIFANAQFEIQKEVTHTICNAIDKATPQQLSYILEPKVIGLLCTMLTAAEGPVVLRALEGLEKILGASKFTPSPSLDSGKIVNEMVEAGALEQIHLLQAHDMEGVPLKATEILEEYFGRRVKSAAKVVAPR